MRSFVSKSSKHFPIEWSLNSATDFGPSPSSPTLLALSSNGCHQASSHLKLHFFFSIAKVHVLVFLSTFINHLLFTKPYSRHITVFFACNLFSSLPQPRTLVSILPSRSNPTIFSFMKSFCETFSSFLV